MYVWFERADELTSTALGFGNEDRAGAAGL